MEIKVLLAFIITCLFAGEPIVKNSNIPYNYIFSPSLNRIGDYGFLANGINCV